MLLFLLTAPPQTAAAPEDPNNGIDEDGDGGDAIRQDFRSTFAGAIPAAATGWIATGGATFPGDVVNIPALGKATWSGNSPFAKGDLFVAMDVDTLGGACTAELTWHQFGAPTVLYTGSFTLLGGTNAYPITTMSPVGVDKIEIRCGAVGNARVDWIALQNGEELFAPVGDVDITWEDVDKPFGGYHNSVTLRGVYSDDTSSADTLLATLDVGGVAFWSEPGQKWEVRNGEWPYMLYQTGELAMTDVAQTSDGEVLAISGEIDDTYVCNGTTDCSTMVRGRLMATSDAGGTWEAEADSYQTTGSGTPAVAVNRRISPYVTDGPDYWGNWDWPKTYAAGRLLENADTSTFVANHIPTTDHVGGYPALALREAGAAGAPADICALTNTGDSTLELPAPTYDATVGWNNVVSALAWIGEPMQGTLLVGYRQRDRLGMGTDSSLWRCDMPVGPVPTCALYESDLECYPVPEGIGIDVADIEVTSSGGQYYAWVADYGYRYSSGTCDESDPTATCEGVISSPGVWRWEVDLGDPTGMSDQVIDISGDLNTTVSAAVTGLMVDDVNLYAFRLGDRDSWYSVVPRHWRIPLAAAESDTGDWITLSEDDAAPIGEGQRDLEYDLADTWADDQEALGNWASTTDGVLYNGRIVGGGLMGIWAFEGLEGAFDGWHVNTLDDDSAIGGFSMFDRADYGGATTFQGTVDTDIAFGAGGRLHVAAGDVGYYRQAVGDRGVVPPQAEVFNSHGVSVATAVTYDVGEVPDNAVWVVLASGLTVTAELPDPFSGGILRSDDNGETFCYQSNSSDTYFLKPDTTATPVMYVGSRYDLPTLGNNYGVSTAGYWDWPACDYETEPFTDDQGRAFSAWGEPMAIEALSADVAIAAFSTTGGAGALAYTLDGSVTWTATTGAPAGVFGGAARMDLITRHSKVVSATDWEIELIYGVAGVGLYRVHIDDSTAPAASWAFLDLRGCTEFDTSSGATAGTLRGVVVSPWADSFVAFGGWSNTSADTQGGACLSDLDALVEATLISPTDTIYQYAIGGVVAHPFLYNTWFIAPIVLSTNPEYCIRTYDGITWDYDFGSFFTACADPLPRMIQKQGTVWRSAPLSIAGLPSLKAIDLAVRPSGASIELGYATQGSGSFRGAASW